MQYTYSGLKLDDTYEVKILISYFMAQIARPMTHNQLAEIVTSDGSVNYFLFSEVVAQMLESGLLLKKDIDGEECYVLSQKARDGANDFKRMVPKSVRDRVLSSGLKFFAKLKNENDVKIDISEEERGYSISCRCTEGEMVLMELKLFALDKDQAELLSEKIMQNPAEFYSKVMTYAVDNEEYDPEPEEVSLI